MNRLCVQLGLTGTAVVGVYDPSARTLSWARAGHPAPLLTLARDRSVGELPPPPGLLLGAEADAAYPVATAALAVGDVVLFYTDGLVERRDAGDATMLLDSVKQALASAGSLEHLRARLHRPSPDDDTCTLAVEVAA